MTDEHNRFVVVSLSLHVSIYALLRSEHHAPEDVLTGCQATLKDLQLDYLDLYLVHGPSTLRKGVTFPNVTEEDKLGYDPERMAKTWEVCVHAQSILPHSQTHSIFQWHAWLLTFQHDSS